MSAIAAVAGLAAAGTPSLAHAAGHTLPVSVSSKQLGPAVPAGFVGLATEYWDLEKIFGSNPNKLSVPMENAVRALAPYGDMNLRFGGDSTDWGWWPISGMKRPIWARWSFNDNWANVARTVAHNLHAKMILGINMEADSPAVSMREVNQLRARLGSSTIDAFELGNEPELYHVFPFYHTKNGTAVRGRPRDYSYEQITENWDGMSSSLKGVPLAGPAYTSLNALPYINQFLGSTHRLSLLTVHTYPLKAERCDGNVPLTESDLFQDSSLQGLADRVASWTRIADRYKVPVRVDEMNSITCGGTPDMSNTLGPALWALNILPLYAEAGVVGVNFNDEPATWQNLIQADPSRSGWRVAIQPEYYGLLEFARLTPPGSRLLRVSAMPAGVIAWAVRTPTNQTHLVLTNVTSGSKTFAVGRPPQVASGSTATVTALRASSGGLKAGVGATTLAGQSISPTTGELSGARSQLSVTPTNGSYTVSVSAASAEILTFG